MESGAAEDLQSETKSDLEVEENRSTYIYLTKANRLKVNLHVKLPVFRF